MLVRTFTLVWLIACKYAPPGDVGDIGIDADLPPPPCEMLGTTCVGDNVHVCSALGEVPAVTACGWGCNTSGGAHCQTVMPTGGALTAMDVDPSTLEMLEEVTLPAGAILDADAGTISPPITGFTFRTTTTPPVGVFHFKSLHVAGALRLRGLQAIAIVADGPITIDGVVDTQSCNVDATAQVQGPGGIHGANKDTSAPLPGGGERPTANSGGAGGGGHGALGGAGGGVGVIGGPGGVAFGDPQITMLVGGGAGAGGKGGGGGVGGGGGAAVQLVSNTSIAIGLTGGINAGGCGGGFGEDGNNDGAGGGGAGGTIVLEAPSIDVAGALSVNGGGGGGSGNGLPGSNGTLDRVAAAGGAAGATGAVGGVGGAGAMALGGRGNDGVTSSGGGGGVGWIRFNTRNSITVDNTRLSPALDDVPTTCSAGPAVIAP